MIDPRDLSTDDISRVAEQLRGWRLASLLDATLLTPLATGSQIDMLVDEAVELGANICVNGSRLERVVERLDSYGRSPDWENLAVGVIDFPLGAGTTEIKAEAAMDLLELGAEEIDVVANVGFLKDGDLAGYKIDINVVALSVAEFNEDEGLSCSLKVIIECCCLTDKEKELASAVVAEVGLENGLPVFVKTSTGFGKPSDDRPVGATIDDVLLLRRTVGPFHPEMNPIGIKAAGGIRDAASAVNLIIAAGGVDTNLKLIDYLPFAVRIGTSSAAAIINDFEKLFGK